MLSPLDVLIVSQRPDQLRPLIRILDASPARVSACFTIRQAQEILSRQPMDLVFCDEYLSDGSYRELLSNRPVQNPISLVLLLRIGEWEEYLDAMRLGACDVLRCPVQPAEVEAVALRMIAHKQKHYAVRQATEAPKSIAGELSQRDFLFEQLLGLAAAALSPRGSAAAASPTAPKTVNHRPMVVRKGAA